MERKWKFHEHDGNWTLVENRLTSHYAFGYQGQFFKQYSLDMIAGSIGILLGSNGLTFWGVPSLTMEDVLDGNVGIIHADDILWEGDKAKAKLKTMIDRVVQKVDEEVKLRLGEIRTTLSDLEANKHPPFRQPFLVIRFENPKFYRGIADGWHVDVDGQIEKYIEGCLPRTIEFAPPANNMDRATPLMKSILEKFRDMNMEVEAITTYIGSAGPSHMFRDGAFFVRQLF